MDAAPLGIAMFGADLRFERVSRRFAEIVGVAPQDHVGRHPHELDSRVVNLLEPVLRQVYRSGQTVSEQLTIEGPDQVDERHLDVSCFPVLGSGGSFHGAGLVVEDVTQEVTSRRRSAHLLSLSQDLTRVVSEEDLAARVTRFLSDVFGGNALVGLVDDGVPVLRVQPQMSGHAEGARHSWERLDVRLDGDDPLSSAMRRGEPLEVDGDETEQCSAGTADAVAAGTDLSAVWVPVLGRSGGMPLAVIRVGWPYRRQITESSLTLLTTVASLMALALNRIRLAAQLADDRFQHALNAMFEDVAVLSPVRDDSGRITDFRVEFTNEPLIDDTAEGEDREDDRSATALDLVSGWRRSGLFNRFVEVVETGEPWVEERFRYHVARSRGGEHNVLVGEGAGQDGSDVDAAKQVTEGVLSIQVVRFDNGCLVASRDVTRMVALEQAEQEASETAHRERIAIEMLQQAALPLQIPRVEGLDIGALYQPALPEQPIGGDWYDVFRLGDQRAAFVIADVSGHGPRSAAFMVKIRNVLRAVATQIETPAEVLRAVNQIICGHYAEAATHFITCCYSVIDMETSRIEWSTAAHPPPILVEASDVGLLDQEPGLPLAVTGSAEYHNHRRALRDGERILLYTDGLFERRDETVDDGLDRLCRVLDKASDLDAQQAVEQLGASVIDPFDDLAAMVIDFRRELDSDSVHR